MAQKTPPVHRSHRTTLAEELRIIREEFAAHLRAAGYAASTVANNQKMLCRLAAALAKDSQSLLRVERDDIPRLLRSMRPSFGKNAQAALHHWLKFHRRFALPSFRPDWQPWIDRFAEHLVTHRGLASDTRRYCVSYARAFLKHAFGDGPACWRRVGATEVWRFAEETARRVKPTTTKVVLSALRIFLRFVQLNGACTPQLVGSVPRIACFGQTTPPVPLSEQQRRRFLRSFRRSPTGRRDYALALCMIDLGLRAGEATRLRLSDFDWRQRCVAVPTIKRGKPRSLPLPEHVAAALLDYRDRGRPACTCEMFFVRHFFPVGRPITTDTVRHAMRRAYRRAGLPRSWCGTHRLRHTFATRLLGRGIDFKPLADLLGHRRLDSTFLYTHADLQGLRQLVQPWPR